MQPFLSSTRMGKRSHEPPAGRIHVDRDVMAGLSLVLVQDSGDLLDGLEVARVGAAQNDEDANGVLVQALSDQVRIEAELTLLRHVEDPRLDLEVPRKLLQRDLGVGAHDDVGSRRVLARRPALFLPSALHGQPSEMDGFGGADCRGAHGVFVLLRTPEVGDDRHAAGVHRHEGGILVCIGQVFGNVLGNEGICLSLHVGANKTALRDISNHNPVNSKTQVLPTQQDSDSASHPDPVHPSAAERPPARARPPSECGTWGCSPCWRTVSSRGSRW